MGIGREARSRGSSDRRGRGRSETEGAYRAHHRSAARPVRVVLVRVARPIPPGRRSTFRRPPDPSRAAKRSRAAPPRYQPGRRRDPRRRDLRADAAQGDPLGASAVRDRDDTRPGAGVLRKEGDADGAARSRCEGAAAAAAHEVVAAGQADAGDGEQPVAGVEEYDVLRGGRIPDAVAAKVEEPATEQRPGGRPRPAQGDRLAAAGAVVVEREAGSAEAVPLRGEIERDRTGGTRLERAP